MLHHNVQCISNKTAELDLLLKSSLENMDVLCFTEHWMKDDYLEFVLAVVHKTNIDALVQL